MDVLLCVLMLAALKSSVVLSNVSLPNNLSNELQHSV